MSDATQAVPSRGLRRPPVNLPEPGRGPGAFGMANVETRLTGNGQIRSIRALPGGKPGTTLHFALRDPPQVATTHLACQFKVPFGRLALST